MKNRSKKKKKIKNMIIFSMIIVIVIIGVILTMKKIEKEKQNEERYNAKSLQNTKYYEGKIFPSGIMKLNSLYTNAGGKISQEIYYQKLYKFVNYFIDLYEFGKTANTEEVNEYFQLNKESIKENIGIYDSENFNRIIEKIKDISKNTEMLGNYKRSEINFNTFFDMENFCIFDTIIYYEKYQNGINIMTYMYKSENDELDVYFDIN